MNLDALNALCAVPIFTEGRTHVDTLPLPFYKDVELIRAQSFSTIPPVTLEFLSTPTGLLKLDGTREPVYEASRRGTLLINEQTLVPYLTFIMGAVQTEEGSLRVVEHFTDELFTGAPTAAARKTLQRLIRPAQLTRTGDKWAVDAIVLYGAAVYQTQLEVLPDGEVNIIDEQLLADNLPIRPIFLE